MLQISSNLHAPVLDVRTHGIIYLFKYFMIKAIVTDCSRVIIFPTDKEYKGKLNPLHEELSKNDNYDFWQYFSLNEELLSFYRKLGEKLEVYMFTTKYIQEYPPVKQKINKVFKKVFIAKDLNVSKKDKQAYLSIVNKIDLKPEEVLYIDDKQKNIEVANQAGLNCILYRNNTDLIHKVQSIV